MHILCVYQALFSDLLNRLENETNYTQNVCSHAQCIGLLLMSGYLYSMASFDIWWYCDNVTDNVNDNFPPKLQWVRQFTVSQLWKKKTSDQQHQNCAFILENVIRKSSKQQAGCYHNFSAAVQYVHLVCLWLSGILYSTTSFNIWHCDARTM